MSPKFLLIDYENIQKVDLSGVPDDILIRIFVGQSQKNIPFDLVQQTQRLGDRLEWLRVNGQGNNALDFHIAFYLGRLHEEHKAASFIILSKDKGFDPLVTHIKSLKRKCRRINSLIEFYGVTDTSSKDPNLKRIIEILSKTEKNKRPRNRLTLGKHVGAMLKEKLKESEVEKIIDYLFIDKLISETGGKISYSF